jgi:hypothetical protein
LRRNITAMRQCQASRFTRQFWHMCRRLGIHAPDRCAVFYNLFNFYAANRQSLELRKLLVAQNMYVIFLQKNLIKTAAYDKNLY